jgi:hypothetical protein
LFAHKSSYNVAKIKQSSRPTDERLSAFFLKRWTQDMAALIFNDNMINITVTNHDEEKRLTADPGQAVHNAIAEAFGCERQEQVQWVLFGDMDVLGGESFEDSAVCRLVRLSTFLPSCLLCAEHW